jgi:hypothetical protein
LIRLLGGTPGRKRKHSLSIYLMSGMSKYLSKRLFDKDEKRSHANNGEQDSLLEEQR